MATAAGRPTKSSVWNYLNMKRKETRVCAKLALKGRKERQVWEGTQWNLYIKYEKAPKAMSQKGEYEV